MDSFFGRTTADKARLDPTKLENLWASIRGTTDSFVVLYGDAVVFERYGQDWDPYRRHGTASAAKALVGGLSLMLAMDDGLIGLDDPAYKYVSQWRDDTRKSHITIRQLAAHASGIEDAEQSGLPHEELPGWKGAFWRRENPFVLARDVSPVLFPPGTRHAYSNPGLAMLTYCVTAALKGSPYTNIRQLIWERIIAPLGIPEAEWSIGYGETNHADGLQLVGSWGGGEISTRCMAAIGLLMLARGRWRNRQLISAKVIDETALTHSGTPGAMGATWAVNRNERGEKMWKTLPADAYRAAGAKHQAMFIIPSRNMIAVRFGRQFFPEKEYDDALKDAFTTPLGEALLPWTIAPKSDLIKEVRWAPASSVLRLATGGKVRDGSDNWPMTWGDDGALYTAYGDGYGFRPQLPSKLGLGFAKIEGMPEDFQAFNIRSDAENFLHGKNGEKAAGLLMAGGQLYLWARNADRKGCGSRLAVSCDHGAHFEWCGWDFARFGHMTFVNYGKNYAGARDGYVYMFSPDNPSAYENGDGFVLLRAPVEKLTDQASYEIYAGMDAAGSPIFSADLTRYKHVLSCPGKARRLSVSFNPGFGRYILWQQHQFRPEESDTRFEGGFGLYEAPEPWGPWKCAYFTENWDIGPGDLGCFPTKWISPDGKTAYLVFSGDDNFCVRKAEFILKDNIGGSV